MTLKEYTETIYLETITIGDIGYAKKDSEEYIQAICGEFDGIQRLRNTS